LLSCGIDDVIFLEPVESSDVFVTSLTNGELRLPRNDSNSYFQNYMIYYRIYTSNFNAPGTPSSSQDLNNINQKLESDYASLSNYTNENSTSTSNMDTIFETRGYYQLYASVDNTNGIAMNDLLDSPSDRVLINLSFTNPSSPPIMTVSKNTNTYVLFRVPNKFTVLPDRLIILSDDLIDKVSSDTNKDVSLGTNSEYAYISLYIIACGIDNSYSTIYSRPTHVGIFQLPKK
jgi:hypothetical protein